MELFEQMNSGELQVVLEKVNQRLNFQRHGGFVSGNVGTGSV